MAAKVKWVGSHVEVDPPKKPLKITGTRLAAILGFNKWRTPFECWCEITRTYKEPFEDTIYTIAGKTIEPKQAEYMKRCYAMVNMVTPTDIYGEDYFKKTWGDFFPNEPILGGAFDYLLTDKDDIPTNVLEMKTTKRAEDWQDDIPEYYAIQAALYAFLLGIDDVIMVCSFLEDADYEHPENFVPSVRNTIVRPFKVSKRYPEFRLMVGQALDWWKKHVVTGISPDYDEKADADTLKALRTNNIDTTGDIDQLIAEGERLTEEIAEATAAVADKEKRLKAIKTAVKQYLEGQFRDGDKTVTKTTERFEWVLGKTVSTELDTDRMKADGIFDQYNTKIKETTRLTVGKKKEKK